LFNINTIELFPNSLYSYKIKARDEHGPFRFKFEFYDGLNQRVINKKNDLINFKGMINILISKTTDNLDLLKSKLDIAQNPCDKFFNDSEIPPKFVQIASNY
jgi:hypothetical protein